MDNGTIVVHQGGRADLFSIVLDGRGAATQVAYRRHLESFRAWCLENGRNGFDRQTVNAFKQEMMDGGLSPATVNQALSALRQAAQELVYHGLDRTAADGIISIPGVPKRGQRLGRWLSLSEVNVLLSAPDTSSLKGLQEKLVLALLAGTALRREEAAHLRVEDIQQINGRWVIANLVGKGNRTRSIPMPEWVHSLVAEWQEKTGVTEGLLLRAINKGGRLAGEVATRGGKQTTGGLSDQAIYKIVIGAADKAGLSKIEPHDLRRTWARLAYNQNPDRLAQISLILGHEGIRTTEIYLGLRQVDLDDPVLLELN